MLFAVVGLGVPESESESVETAESSQMLSLVPAAVFMVTHTEPSPVRSVHVSSSPSVHTGAHSPSTHVKPSRSPEQVSVHERSTFAGRHAVKEKSSVTHS